MAYLRKSLTPAEDYILHCVSVSNYAAPQGSFSRLKKLVPRPLKVSSICRNIFISDKI